MPVLNRFLADEVEFPLVRVVADLEDAGYAIDVGHFERLRERLEPEQAAVLEQIRACAGESFNPGSPKQLQTLLFERLGLPILKRTKKGQPSTNTSTLKRLTDRHEVVPLIVRYRKLKKILGTYCTIAEKVDDDGRLRVNLNQLGAETGRFASGSVIQQMPRNDEFRLRDGFVAAPGHRIVGTDFDQQELRVLAQVSGDRSMRKAIADGVDLHGLAAVKVFGLDCDPNAVKSEHPELRSQVKAVQFGLIYGKTAFGLAQSLGISREVAGQLIAGYFAQYPKVRKLIDDVHRRLHKDRFVEDVFGRRRYFPTMPARPPRRRSKPPSRADREKWRRIFAAERAAQNFVIQGAAVTVTKLAMLRCHAHIQAKHPRIRMVLTLHDELQFEVPDDEVEHFAAELPGLMCDLDLGRFGFVVPMSVEVKVGPSWGRLAKWTGGAE